MEITIQIDGQALPVEVSIEAYTYLDQAAHKDENLAHEQRRHWDMRELILGKPYGIKADVPTLAPNGR